MEKIIETTLHYVVVVVLLVAGFLYLQSQLPSITESLSERLTKAANVR